MAEFFVLLFPAACPPGTQPGEASCNLCPRHTYRDVAVSDQCTPCEPGLGTALPGATGVHLCTPLQEITEEDTEQIGMYVFISTPDVAKIILSFSVPAVLLCT